MEKIYNLLGLRKNGIILCHSDSIKGKRAVVRMESITKEQENKIDKSHIYYGNTCFVRDDKHIVENKNIYLYGEVNLEDEQDINNIKRFHLLNPEHNWKYSNFDYENGTYTTIEGFAKGCDTWDSLEWFKYCYCLLGKPKRIIVYRCPLNMIPK